MNSRALIGTAPIGFDTRDKKIKWAKEDLQNFQKLTDNWLHTLDATHQLNTLPLKSYLKLSFKYPNIDDKIMQFYNIPDKADDDSHKNIYLQGQDNGEVKYYLFTGGKRETLAIINWMKKNKPTHN